MEPDGKYSAGICKPDDPERIERIIEIDGFVSLSDNKALIIEEVTRGKVSKRVPRLVKVLDQAKDYLAGLPTFGEIHPVEKPAPDITNRLPELDDARSILRATGGMKIISLTSRSPY